MSWIGFKLPPYVCVIQLQIILYIGFLEMMSNLSKIQSSTKVKVNPLIYVDISCPSQ